MQKGSSTRNIKWDKYIAPSLNLSVPNTNLDCASCGTAALSLITGISPKNVEKYCPDAWKGWYTSRVIKFLRMKGYKVIEVTKNSVTNTYWQMMPIGYQHCLIVTAHTNQDDASMFVLHKGNIWHNFHKNRDNALLFINKPTQDVLLVWHKKWNKEKRKAKYDKKSRFKNFIYQHI